MYKRRFWLIGFIWIAFALRLFRLDGQSLWYDEGVTWLLSQMPLADLIQWTAADIQPPLYYLVIWTTDIIYGDSEWALRFPSAIFSVLTLPLLYHLTSRLSVIAPPRSSSPPQQLTMSNEQLAKPHLLHPSNPPTLRLRSGQALHPSILPSFHPSILPPFHFITLLLFTLSPAMVYYSQEARMYTLLILEATWAGYLLLKLLHPLRPAKTIFGLPRVALAYALIAAAGLYTHYFAAFLLAAHALYSLLVLWQHRFERQLLAGTSLAFGGSLLLFTPWLPTLFARLGDDPSYWPGALKLDEALRQVLITFIAGETVIEQTGWRLVLVFAGLVCLALLWLLIPTRQLTMNNEQLTNPPLHPSSPPPLQPSTPPALHPSSPPPLQPSTPPSFHPSILPSFHPSIFFLLLWLLLPLSLILALSYQSPKFNPRYILLAWPAFALLSAYFLSRLFVPSLSRPTSHVPRPTLYTSRSLGALILLVLVGTSLYSLTNWFSDRRFMKDDFRALAQFIQERRAEDETVLLSSGHLFPVFAYYYGWEGWTPMPWLLRLDINRVTTLDIAAEMSDALAGQGGVWLVTWQDEVIDPNGVVPFWLDRIGERPNDAGDFWGVGLDHWRLDPDCLHRLHEDPIERRATINFANRVDLLGYTQLSDTELALFWQAKQPLPDNLNLTLDLIDSDGFDWDRATLTGRPGAYLYPPSRWPVGQMVLTRHPLPWQIGTPPGLYLAEIGLGEVDPPADETPAAAASSFTGWDVLDEQGRPQRRTALLPYLNLSDLVRPDSGPLPPDPEPEAEIPLVISLRRTILPASSPQPGDRLLLALLWQAGAYNVDPVSVAFDLIDATGQTFRVGSAYTPSRRFDLPRWQPGDVVLGQYWLTIPPEAAPGPASLQLHLVNVTGFKYDEVFPLAQLEIRPTARTFSLPARIDQPLEADFSGLITLLGADCPNACRAAPGQSLPLTLYWRAEVPIDTAYTVFTHALGPAETVLINADHAPPKPTQAWVPGEIITDPVTLTLPPDLPPGQYPLEIGLYNAADPAFPRLSLTNGENRVILPQSLVVK